MKTTRSLLVALALTLSLTGANAIIFTTDFTIAAGDTTYDGQDIGVSGCTLKVNGAHSFASVTVYSGSTLTHSPATANQSDRCLDLNIGGDVTVQAGGFINVSGAGYAPDSGPGTGAGASYGGTGGGGGPVYGSVLQPADVGSGGSYSWYWGGGSPGGGRAKLVVQGTVTINGSLLAAGADSGGNAGAGGSLWLAVGQLAGNGAISANGGNGYGGGGGGGRIAIYYSTNAFGGTLTACGGGGGPRGGPGTVLLQATTASVPFLKLDNGGTAGTWTPLDLPQAMDVLIAQGAQMYPTVPQTFNSLHIASGGYLIHAAACSNLNATVLGDATVDAGGCVYASGQGFPNDTGPGAGPSSPGSHGGQGALGSGATYDSILEPTWKGSGGSYNQYWGPGSAGGGVVRLIVNGTLTVNGVMEANGLVAAGAGGAGGALWLTVGKLAGAGSITANGGGGNAGGGGGGRIAIYWQTNEFSGPVTAFGGSSGNDNGGPGTILTKAIGASAGSLVLDNNGRSGKWTPLAVPEPMHVRLTNGANIYPAAALTLQSLLVQSNGWLIHNAGYALTNVQITVLENATVDLGGGLSADGQGYPADQGPGSYSAAGGSHGGVGGAGAGTIYDSLLEPVWRGSGGSYGSYWGPGQPGGGAFHFIVNGTFTLNGRFTANGLNGSTSGGAGGSLWLSLGKLAGNGSLSAEGGNAYAGGGGGGRIAIYMATNDFTGLITAGGGSGGGNGGPGTVFTQITGEPFGRLVLDNNGRLGTWTPLALPVFMHVRIAGGAQMYPVSPQTCQSLLVQSNGWIMHKAEFANVDLTVREDATFEAGTGLWADGQGYPADVSYDGATGPVGGSHGGLGGGAGVRDYDAVDQPVLKGSGGGYGSYWGAGAAGGGVLRFTVNGRLTLAGTCTANGLNGSTGGGAGGSIWLTVGELAGTGGIGANGGSAYAGGGGGGRIAIYFTTNSFAGTVTAYGRGSAGGAGTIYWKAASASVGTVWLDNAGAAGNYTPLDASARYQLEMSNAVSVITRQPLLLASLHMAAGTWITHLQSGPPLTADVTVLGDAVIDDGAEISANGRGYPADTGPGAGSGGGSYGGHGGGASGPTYGSESAPTDWGSGGSYNSYWGAGAPGGGALRLSVGGTLAFNGRASVTGFNGNSGGGGAGGSIWVSAVKLTGTGTMVANGGSGYSACGGGGRIAVISPDRAGFAGSVLAQAGGVGAEAGTVFYAASPASLAVSQQTPAGTVTRPVAYLDLTFTNALDPASFTAADVTFTTPTGAVATAALTVTPVGGAIYRLGFPTQAALGTYQLAVGPGIQDIFGQTMTSAYHGSFAIAPPAISGTITNSAGVAVPGVLLSASDGSSATSGAAGEYHLAVTPGFTGTVTPTKSGWVFVPGRRSYASVLANSTNQNFLAVLGSLTTTLSVVKDGNNLALSWSTYAGARYQLQSATNMPAASWREEGAPFVGTGGPLGTSLPIGTEAPKFLRLQIEN